MPPTWSMRVARFATGWQHWVARFATGWRQWVARLATGGGSGLHDLQPSKTSYFSGGEACNPVAKFATQWPQCVSHAAFGHCECQSCGRALCKNTGPKPTPTATTTTARARATARATATATAPTSQESNRGNPQPQPDHKQTNNLHHKPSKQTTQSMGHIPKHMLHAKVCQRNLAHRRSRRKPHNSTPPPDENQTTSLQTIIRLLVAVLWA